MNWLTVVVMWCSVIIGFVLAVVAEEELAVGKKYFDVLRIGLFLSVLVVLGVMLFSTIRLDLGILFGMGMGLGMIHLFLQRNRLSVWMVILFELVCFIWATVVVLMVGEEFVELGLLFVSLFFMYGVVVGTLLNIKNGVIDKLI